MNLYEAHVAMHPHTRSVHVIATQRHRRRIEVSRDISTHRTRNHACATAAEMFDGGMWGAPAAAAGAVTGATAVTGSCCGAGIFDSDEEASGAEDCEYE